jgi:hypothetical protein
MPEHKLVVKATDTREIRVPIPADQGNLSALGTYIVSAAEDGFNLTGASAIEHGQRDPFTVGLRLTFKREP